MRGHNGRHARLGVVFLRVHGHATGGDDVFWLQRRAVHDHVLGRPVSTGNRQLVLVALELGGVHRARFEANANLGHVIGLGHPQVNHVDPAITANHEQIAPRCRSARDVHRVAGLDDVDDFFGVAVNQRHFAGIAQRGGEDVGDVEVVHLLGGPVFGRHRDFPRLLHVRHAPLGRLGRVLLDVARHHVHVGLAHFARGLPIGHASRRAVSNKHLQVFSAFFQRDIGR